MVFMIDSENKYFAGLYGVWEDEGGSVAEVTKFEDKVREALSAVMKHAVTGHGSNVAYHSYCNNAGHAIHILAEHGIRPVNESVAARLLDNG